MHENEIVMRVKDSFAPNFSLMRIPCMKLLTVHLSMKANFSFSCMEISFSCIKYHFHARKLHISMYGKEFSCLDLFMYETFRTSNYTLNNYFAVGATIVKH